MFLAKKMILILFIAFLCLSQNDKQSINDLFLKELHKINQVVGMSAAIVKDGKLFWSGEIGYSDLEKKKMVNKETKFRFASVSKFITTAILAGLVEEKKIDPEKSIYEYYPEYPKKKYDFTLKQLANHTAGIPHYQFGDFLNDRKKEAFKNVEEGIEIFKDRDLLFEPGTEYQYSSFAFNLISRIMEKASGKSFLELLDEFTLRADLKSIEGEKLNSDKSLWSKLYDKSSNEKKRGNISYKWAGGGLIGNAVDLAKAGNMLLDQNYISKETLKYFNTSTQYKNGNTVKGKRFEMGIGWRLSKDYYGRFFFHHSGAMTGARSHISVYPDDNLVVAILSNTSWVSAMDITAASFANNVLSNTEEEPGLNKEFFYTSNFNGDKISGKLEFIYENKIQKVKLFAGKLLRNFLNKYQGKNESSYSVYKMGKTNSIIVPFGIFPVKVSGKTMELFFNSQMIKLKY